MVAAPSEATDNQLVEAARAGSDVAFEALFRRYRVRITAYVRNIVADHGRVHPVHHHLQLRSGFVPALAIILAVDSNLKNSTCVSPNSICIRFLSL